MSVILFTGGLCPSMHHRQWRIQDFPQGGAPTPKSAIIFQFFGQKLHENERIWTPGGGGGARPWCPSLDPPMTGHMTERVSVWEGLCPGGSLWAVCIRLECILVFNQIKKLYYLKLKSPVVQRQ